MADLRKRVEEDRGLLKRIQLHVPGFAGYRRRDDLRTADSMLRIQIANGLRDLRTALDGSRAALSARYQLRALEPLGALILKAQSLEGQVRHAEQGYSPLVTDVKVLEPQVNQLYEWDASLLDGVASMTREASALEAEAVGDAAKVLEHVRTLQRRLADLEATFKRRMLVITGTEVG